MLPPMALAQAAAGPFHQHGLVIEMVTHEFLKPRDEERKLNLLAVHGAKPPICDYLMVRIDYVMT